MQDRSSSDENLPSDNQTIKPVGSRQMIWRVFRAIARHPFRSFFLFVVMLVIGDLLYLAMVAPNWSDLAKGKLSKSRYMLRYEKENPGKKIHWRPVPLAQIPSAAVKMFIIAEDSRFYTHKGIDTTAITDAMNYNWKRGKMVLGGSTISQQTVKNLSLSFSRNPLRKWHELLLTLQMERRLTKRQILEVYLNIIEFGPGVFGISAAALTYWNIPASALTEFQASELAASLPSPRRNNPNNKTRFFVRQHRRIWSTYLTYIAVPKEVKEASVAVSEEVPHEAEKADASLVPGQPSLDEVLTVKDAAFEDKSSLAPEPASDEQMESSAPFEESEDKEDASSPTPDELESAARDEGV